MNKLIGHFRTITKHRHTVIKYCFKCGIGFQGLFHDLSKYSPTEFFAGARYYLGTKSPNEAQRKKNGYSAAWMHHKGRNRHHFEYWTDINTETKKYAPVEMPLNYFVEMFCDRIAASKVYYKEKYTDSTALDYFNHSQTSADMHPATYEKMRLLLEMLAEKGEEETIRYVRELVKDYKKKK